MANKLTTVIDNIETALKTIGNLTVKRGLINPLTEKNPPVVSLAASRFRRRDDTWMCELLIQAVAVRDSATDPDEAAANLAADMQDKIDGIVNAGTAGGWIAEPTWECWYAAASGDFPARPVGVLGLTTVRIDGALKSS